MLPKIGHRIILDNVRGHIVVFSDAHWWPDEDRSTAFRALVKMCKDLRPAVMIANGDLFDGARISRFPTGWTKLPSVKGEIKVVRQRLTEICKALPHTTRRIWLMGNHDSRMALRLAQVAPEFEGVRGLDLKDHFEDLRFTFGWSALINNDLFIKHRWLGGEHAGHRNAQRAGCNICTGHDHTLKVAPVIDVKGIRWGVTCGSLSAKGPDVPKFAYGEDNPTQHNEGFAVFTYRDGILLPPELVQVIDGVAYFRGSAVTPVLKRKKAAQVAASFG